MDLVKKYVQGIMGQVYDLVENDFLFIIGVNSKRQVSVLFENKTNMSQETVNAYKQKNLILYNHNNKELTQGTVKDKDIFYRYLNDCFKTNYSEVSLLMVNPDFRKDFDNLIKKYVSKANAIFVKFDIPFNQQERYYSINYDNNRFEARLGWVSLTYHMGYLLDAYADYDYSIDKKVNNFFQSGRAFGHTTSGSVQTLQTHKMLVELSSLGVELADKIGKLYVKNLKK